MRFPQIGAAARTVVCTAVCTVFVLLSGCSAADLVDVGNDSDVIDPAVVNTYEGAVKLYSGTLLDLVKVYPQYLEATGLFSDELAAGTRTGSAIDQRSLVGVGASAELGTVFKGLQALRLQSEQSVGALRKYSNEKVPAQLSRMYAMQGYADVLLAELFCNGIPLSDISVGGGALQYSAALTTDEVLDRAIAQFDSAIALAGDSTRLVALAAIGKGRALLDQGKYAAAAAAVSGVLTTDLYEVEYSSQSTFGANPFVPATYFRVVADSEGHTGLGWITDNDPRVVTTLVAGRRAPGKYPTASTPIPLATGIEARLIEAEADLKANGTQWLNILNTLRSDAGTAGLSPLADPGSADARVDLVFRERAYWMYLTGHRLGDMRRLVRQYGRGSPSIFAVGTYPYAQEVPIYGSAVVAPVPSSEKLSNPRYTGCIDLNA